MIQFICLFFPSVLSVWIMERIQKRNFNLKEFIYYFILSIIFINLLIFLVIYIFSDSSIEYLSKETFTLLFSIKYLVLSFSLSLLFPIFFSIVKSNFDFSISIDENEKISKKLKKIGDEKKNGTVKKNKNKK